MMTNNVHYSSKRIDRLEEWLSTVGKGLCLIINRYSQRLSTLAVGLTMIHHQLIMKHQQGQCHGGLQALWQMLGVQAAVADWGAQHGMICAAQSAIEIMEGFLVIFSDCR